MKKILLLVLILGYGLFGLYFLYDQNKLFAKDQSPLKSQDAQNIFQKCRNNNVWNKCYSGEFVSYNKSHSLEQTIKIVSAIQIVDERANNCHIFAHTIAHNEMKKDTSDWRNTVSKMSSGLCGGGFIHGAIESLRIFNPDFKMNKTNILDFCTLVSDDKTSVDRVCLHGVGHILVVEHGGDIDASQKICSNFEPRLQRACLIGVFMENMTGETLTRHTGIQRKEPTWDVILQQEKACSKYSGLSSQICWREMTHGYFTFANGDYKKAYELCSRAPGSEETRQCYLHILNHIIIKYNPPIEKLRYACAFYEKSDDQYKQCTDMVVFGLTHKIAFDKNRAQNYCKTMDGQYKKYCLDLVDAQEQSRSDLKQLVDFQD